MREQCAVMGTALLVHEAVAVAAGGGNVVQLARLANRCRPVATIQGAVDPNADSRCLFDRPGDCLVAHRPTLTLVCGGHLALLRGCADTCETPTDEGSPSLCNRLKTAVPKYAPTVMEAAPRVSPSSRSRWRVSPSLWPLASWRRRSSCDVHSAA